MITLSGDTVVSELKFNQVSVREKTFIGYSLVTVGGVQVGFTLALGYYSGVLVSTVELSYPLRVFGDGSFIPSPDLLCWSVRRRDIGEISMKELYSRFELGLRLVKNYGRVLNSDDIARVMCSGKFQASAKNFRLGVLKTRLLDYNLSWWFTGAGV